MDSPYSLKLETRVKVIAFTEASNAGSGGEYAAGQPENFQSELQPPQGIFVMLKNPIVQGVLTVLAVIIVLKFASTYVAKIPVIGPYLAI